MSKGLKNWTYKDVVCFLKQHFFKHSHIKGSHCYYTGNVDNKKVLTWIPKHNSKPLPILTLKCTISKSGIPELFWKKWAEEQKKNKKNIQYEGAKK